MSRDHHRESGTGPSQRALRAGEVIRHAIADILSRGEVHDPVIEGHLITVPEVRLSPDLKLATIYVMPLGGRDVKEVLAALERNKRWLRGEIDKSDRRLSHAADAEGYRVHWLMPIRPLSSIGSSASVGFSD